MAGTSKELRAVALKNYYFVLKSMEVFQSQEEEKIHLFLYTVT